MRVGCKTGDRPYLYIGIGSWGRGDRAGQTRRQSMRRQLRNAMTRRAGGPHDVAHLLKANGNLKLRRRLRRKTNIMTNIMTLLSAAGKAVSLSRFEKFFWNRCCSQCKEKAAQFGF